MSVNYVIKKRKVHINQETVEKYIATIKLGTVIELDTVADHLEKRSTLSRGDIIAVLVELESIVATLLMTGHEVSLGYLGKFVPAIRATSVDSPEEVTNSSIKGFRCIFKPSVYLRKKFEGVSFTLFDKKIRYSGGIE